MLAGDGNDWMLFDADDGRVDGGAGIDTLAIQTNATVNFTGLAGTRITGIEELDLTGFGNQTVSLSAADVFAFSDTTETIKIHGGAGDKVSLGRVGTVTLDANGEAAMSEPFTYDASNVEKFAKFF